jgi:hypothetical protein
MRRISPATAIDGILRELSNEDSTLAAECLAARAARA